MKTLLISAIALLSIGARCAAAEFEAPVRLMSNGEPIRVESPGYASPCWADINGDGNKDLLVGQFNGGKIRLFLNQGDGELGEGKWLETEGEIAEVPGVW